MILSATAHTSPDHALTTAGIEEAMMTTSTIRWAAALFVAGALNTLPALASGAPFPSAARTNAMDETIYRPDCRSDEDYGTRNPCWIRGFGGGRP